MLADIVILSTDIFAGPAKLAGAEVAVTIFDGKVVYRLQVPANVPVDAFWSVAAGGGSVNSLTAKKAEDGSVAIQFGRCAGTPNCLQTTSGWSYTVRLYRPRPEVLDGSWQFPVAQPVRGPDIVLSP